MIKIIIEQGKFPGNIFIGIEAKVLEQSPYYTIHIVRLGETREDVIFSTGLYENQIGTLIDVTLHSHMEAHMYCIHVGAEKEYQWFINSIDASTTIAHQYFSISENSIKILTPEDAELKRASQLELVNAPLYTKEEIIIKKNYQIVVFCAGINLYYRSPMKGMCLVPLAPGVSNSSVLEAFSDYLVNNHNVDPARLKLQQYLRYQPSFAIHFSHIVSDVLENAIDYVNDQVRYINSVLAIEHGDRPYPLLTFWLDRDTGICDFLPKSFDSRSNLLAPLIPSNSSDQIQKIYPIIKQDPYARLVLELYVQTIAERDRPYRFLRQWSLLEFIAEKNIAVSNTPITDHEGKEIYSSDTRKLTTKDKAGKVYELLKTKGFGQISQGLSNGFNEVIAGANGGYNPGGNVIPLYDAVAAAYKIRNAVAHDGTYSIDKTPKTSAEHLARRLFMGEFGFLEHAVDYIALPEISKIEKINPSSVESM